MMNAFQILLLLFLVIPIVEIYVLLQIGGVLGAVPTVALVVLTAVVGAALMRSQGFRTLARVQNAMAAGEIPAVELIEGAFILVAGALLLTPGFVTDAIGFVFLFPPLRVSIIRAVLSGQVRAAGGGRGPGTGGASQPGVRRGNVIDGEIERDTHE